MDSQVSLDPPHDADKRSKLIRKRGVIVGVACALLLLVVVVVVVTVVVVVVKRGDTLRATFMRRCEAFPGSDCKNLWTLFQQAYVGKDPCNVPPESYDPLITAAPFQPKCNQTIFWSKTKDMVHDFTKKRPCFTTVEDTVLGASLDALTWCGKKGSTETLTSDCPAWSDCPNNPVRSFWIRISDSFADAACGRVTAMLNGSLATPFWPDSVFALEVEQFNPSKVNSLTIVLVTPDTAPVSDCANASFIDLKNRLGKGIQFICKEVSESQLQKCSSNTNEPCSPCW